MTEPKPSRCTHCGRPLGLVEVRVTPDELIPLTCLVSKTAMREHHSFALMAAQLAGAMYDLLLARHRELTRAERGDGP